MEKLLRNAIKILKSLSLRVFYIDLIYHFCRLFLRLIIYCDMIYHPYLFLHLRIYSDVVTYFVSFFATVYDTVSVV